MLLFFWLKPLLLVFIPFALILLAVRSAWLRRLALICWTGILLMSLFPVVSMAVVFLSAVNTTTNTAVPYQSLITVAATKHGLDPLLLMALVEVESNFEATAVSKSGAMGLTQLMPGTAAELGVLSPFAPAENLDAGARYLSWLLDYYENDLDLALSAYNAGPGNVDSCRCVYGNEAYVQAVKEAAQRYRSSGFVRLPYLVTPRITQGLHGLPGWEGVDYAAGCGSVLVAPISGRVAHNGLDGYERPGYRQNTMLTILGGNTAVTLLHGDYTVRVGQWVQVGQPIGYEAANGWATGCHTHLIVKMNGRIVDPRSVLNRG